MPLGQYGVNPVNYGSQVSHNRRTSATTHFHTRMNSSDMSFSIKKEASVKQLRMHQYLQGTAMAANTVANLQVGSHVSNHMALAMNKSPVRSH